MLVGSPTVRGLVSNSTDWVLSWRLPSLTVGLLTQTRKAL